MIILSFLLVLNSVAGILQNEDLIISAREFQEELDNEYANLEESPLDKKDLKEFDGLDFFEIDPEYIVKAEFERTPSEAPFAIRTRG